MREKWKVEAHIDPNRSRGPFMYRIHTYIATQLSDLDIGENVHCVPGLHQEKTLKSSVQITEAKSYHD